MLKCRSQTPEFSNELTASDPPIEEPTVPTSNTVDPNQPPPGSVVYQTNGLTPEDIRAAFAKVKDDRKKQIAEMRKKEAEQEKQQELKDQQNAKRIQEERDKLQKEKELEAAKKKK
uniref:Uncharacterized protein n=1 Tax=Acrobeloides nanus TaxID=290746 RepID=A0A914BYR8_9BILA